MSRFFSTVSMDKLFAGWAEETFFYLGHKGKGKKAPRLRFLVFAQGRTGSSLLCSLLGDHPDITCARELFATPRLNPRLWADRQSRTAKTPVFGFKAKSYQISKRPDPKKVRSFLTHLLFHGWQIVHLRRENLFRQSLSNFYASRSNRYETQPGAPAARIQPFKVPCERLAAMIRERETWISVEREALRGLPHISLSYEEDLMPEARHQTVCNHLFDLFEVKRRPVSTLLVPTTPRSWKNFILNPEAVRTTMKREGFGAYLEDPRYEETLNHVSVS